ncbi:hypothetical protein VNO78_17526 [Psophocarpus tetragonolobus]|uniref:Uncharacterized protein n=1 Tax=Psophocarpus tetragonolobus TaxID=3891 RepID=A0AAN9SHX2_PSOTE
MGPSGHNHLFGLSWYHASLFECLFACGEGFLARCFGDNMMMVSATVNRVSNINVLEVASLCPSPFLFCELGDGKRRSSSGYDGEARGLDRDLPEGEKGRARDHNNLFKLGRDKLI